MNAFEFLENLKNEVLKGFKEDYEKKEIEKQIEKAEKELRDSKKETLESLLKWVHYYIYHTDNLSREFLTLRALEMKSFHNKIIKKECLLFIQQKILCEFNLGGF